MSRSAAVATQSRISCRGGGGGQDRVNENFASIECTTVAPATIAPVINANVKRNSNPKPNPNLNPYPTPNQNPNRYPHSNSLLPEISWQEQLSPEQMSDHHAIISDCFYLYSGSSKPVVCHRCIM